MQWNCYYGSVVLLLFLLSQNSWGNVWPWSWSNELLPALSTLGYNEIPLYSEEGSECPICHYQDLADRLRNNYTDKVEKEKTTSKKNKKQKHPSFLPANFIRCLKRKYFKTFFSISLHFSALLIFTLFMKISSLVSPYLRTSSLSLVSWRPESKAIYFLVWRPISGESRSQHSDPSQQ